MVRVAKTKTKKKLALLLILLLLTTPEQKNRKRFWTKEWLLNREKFSHMKLLKYLQNTSNEDLKNYLRMDEECFEKLLKMIKPYMQRRNTRMRRAISVRERLVVTLRYLATGRSFEDLKFSSIISPQALGKIIPETCHFIHKALKTDYMKFPSITEEWQEISRNIENRWNFPNCGGSIDGKHIRIVKPANSGSYFFNYKGYHSIVLMALVDANYEFVYVNVGCNGRVSDGGIIEYTKFYDKLLEKKLNLPSNNETKEHLNFVFVTDDAFALHQNILKPFSGNNLTAEESVFNYRLSRVRRTVENAFGILANRFRVFHTAINMKPKKIDKVVLAACTLHNFLRRNVKNSYISNNYIDREILDTGDIVVGDWRTGITLDGLRHGSGRNASREAKENRELYKNYFNNKGKVSWQNNFI